MDDSAIMRSRQHRRAPPYPILAFLCRERIEVDDHIPGRVFAAKSVERRRSPQTARMLGVAPEVEQISTVSIGNGNVVRPVKDAFQDVPIRCKALMTEALQGRRVLRLDPCKGARALDLFEPKVGIVVRGRERRPCVDGHRMSFVTRRR
jgi:hypothetical protein